MNLLQLYDNKYVFESEDICPCCGKRIFIVDSEVISEEVLYIEKRCLACKNYLKLEVVDW
jgi:uncharacterized protein with PIN domain